MSDCRTCKHNTYHGSPQIADWVDCSHPTTIAKAPRPEPGDPAWVNLMTADMKVGQMLAQMVGVICPAWEQPDDQ